MKKNYCSPDRGGQSNFSGYMRSTDFAEVLTAAQRKDLPISFNPYL